jgi:hypothetical protein
MGGEEVLPRGWTATELGRFESDWIGISVCRRGSTVGGEMVRYGGEVGEVGDGSRWYEGEERG